jgi:hypothetical protein
MKISFVFLFFLLTFSSIGQENTSIVSIIDDLTVRWDETAIRLKDYQGIQNFCANNASFGETIQLLDDIHHWDTTLYFTVQEKYADTNDEEAQATLRDIETLETDYTTENFKNFILAECEEIKAIESRFPNETIKEYEKDVKSFEKELKKYLTTITKRIDIIDEHVHHLNLE